MMKFRFKKANRDFRNPVQKRKHLSMFERKQRKSEFKHDNRLIGQNAFGKHTKIVQVGRDVFLMKTDKHGDVNYSEWINKRENPPFPPKQ